MATWSTDKAPTWAKDAIATDRGWVCPKTGQVLVACKRLKDAVSYNSKFGKGGVPKAKKRGGARAGSGRKSDAERQRIKEEHAAAAEAATKLAEELAAAEAEAYEIEAARVAEELAAAEAEAHEEDVAREADAQTAESSEEDAPEPEKDTPKPAPKPKAKPKAKAKAKPRAKKGAK